MPFMTDDQLSDALSAMSRAEEFDVISDLPSVAVYSLSQASTDTFAILGYYW